MKRQVTDGQLWLRLLLRGIHVQLMEVARTSHVLLNIRDLSLRQGERESVFGPWGMFAKGDRGRMVPVSSFAPLGAFSVTPHGGIVSPNLNGMPEDPDSGEPLIIEGLSEEDHARVALRVEQVREDLQKVCNRYDVGLHGVLYVMQKPHQVSVSPEAILAVATFWRRPLETLLVSLAKDCRGEIDEAELLVNDTPAGTLRAGEKPIPIVVPRGKCTVGIMVNGDRRPDVILDMLADRTFTITCQGEGLENAIARTFYGEEHRPPQFTIHPRAAEKLNRDVEPIARLLRVMAANHNEPEPVANADEYGQPTSFMLRRDGNLYWLEGEGVQRLLSLASDIASRKEFRGEVSEETVRALTFEWLVQQNAGVEALDSYGKYLGTGVGNAVGDFEVHVPIHLLEIESSFWVGRVRLVTDDNRTLSDRELAEGEVVGVSPKEGEAALTDWRGNAWGVCMVHADERRALALALAEVERSVMLLRFYSPSALDPRLPCKFGPLGKMHVPRTVAWIVNGKVISDTVDRPDVCGDPLFRMGDDEKRHMEDMGLRRAGRLVNQWTHNELERLVLRSMEMFVHGIETADSLDRLVFTLSASETLLLGGDTDAPIQETVALRLGYLCVETVEGRRRVKEIIKKAYKLRSGYLHRGREQRDLAVLQELQGYVWTAVNHATKLSEHLKTPDELFQLIEQSVLS